MGDEEVHEDVCATMKCVCSCTTSCVGHKEENGQEEGAKTMKKSAWAMRKCMVGAERRVWTNSCAALRGSGGAKVYIHNKMICKYIRPRGMGKWVLVVMLAWPLPYNNLPKVC